MVRRFLWEFPKGTGHSTPAVVGDQVVLFHRLGENEVVDCLHAQTGKALWHFQYPAPYRDRYGAGEGTRTSPVIEGGHVFVFGINGLLHCLASAGRPDLAAGSRDRLHNGAELFR